MTIKVGSIYDGKVTGLTKFGAFVQIEEGQSGLVHISEVSQDYVNDIKEHLSEGQGVRVKVLNVDEKGRVNLSIKKAQEIPKQQEKKPVSFEDMLSKFKQDSDDKFSVLKQPKDIKRDTSRRRK